MREIRYLQAVAEALNNEMKINDDVLVMGEDVRESLRGVTKGLYNTFGKDRVIDFPISEQGMIGCGIGSAISGFRPVIEFQINEFTFFAFEQLILQSQRLRFYSGGKIKIPVTYVVPGSGARGGISGQHSDNPYSFLIHGGMKVVIPSSAYDAKGLLVSAIRDNDPVAVFLPTRVLAEKGEVPEEQYAISLGKAEIKKTGSDVTVVATGHCVNIALDIARKLDTEGISVEVFDPRTLFPFDKETLKKSISKTGKVVIIDDSPISCGFSNEVSALIGEEYFNIIKAPVKIIARADVPIPFSEPLEEYVLPNSAKLENAIYKLIGRTNA
ncbi:MAG: alpha-ketoacid dehydrogenase subunit beta [Candidatus Humimicrobiaceae bacterium]